MYTVEPGTPSYYALLEAFRERRVFFVYKEGGCWMICLMNRENRAITVKYPGSELPGTKLEARLANE